MSLIPDIPPKLFSLSAVAVGYLLIDDLTANEQNALGNWLMLAAQVICTNAYYKQVETERSNQQSTGLNVNETIIMLNKMVNALNQEIAELKKNNWQKLPNKKDCQIKTNMIS